jgi:hypothetical protein
MKKMKIGQVFGYLVEKIYFFFQIFFLRFTYFIVDIYAMPVPSRPKGHRAVSTYNC